MTGLSVNRSQSNEPAIILPGYVRTDAYSSLLDSVPQTSRGAEGLARGALVWVSAGAGVAAFCFASRPLVPAPGSPSKFSPTHAG